MTTNYTTEGMIDEKFGINFGRIKVKENMLKENLTKKPEQISLLEIIKIIINGSNPRYQDYE